MAQGIDVGDAVLSFVADTTKLDGAFARVGAEAKTGLQPATDALDEVADGFKGAGTAATASVPPITAAAEATKVNMYEARGEVRLLGEEIGVRLPRHVGNFVASLPGVGEAMQAAFSATAVLFIAQAVVQVTEKVSDWAGRLMFNTDAVKANHDALVAANAEVFKSAQAYDAAKKALDEFGKSQLQLAQEGLATLNTQLIQANKDLAAAQEEVAKGVQTTGEAFDSEGQSSAQATEEDEKNYQVAQNLVFVKQALVRTLNEQIKAQEETKVDPAAQEAADKAEAQAIKNILDRQKELNEVQERYNRSVEEAEKQTKELEKTIDSISREIKSSGPIDIVTPDVVKNLLAMRSAAQALGVTLRSDLVARLQEAQIAKDKFIETMGDKDTQQIALFDAAIKKAQVDVQQFGKVSLEEQLKLNKAALDNAEAELIQARAHHANTSAIEQEIATLKKEENALKASINAAEKAKGEWQEFQTTIASSSQAMGTAIESAMSGVVEHQKNIGKELEKAVFQMLGSMAAQWGAYFIATGTGMMFLPGGQANGAGMIAEGMALEALAGVLNGLGSVAGGSAGASASGGGNGGNVFAYGSSVSDTGSQGGSGRSNISVQGYADGALVSSPTLAVFGESGREAALPLDNPDAMATIGKAVSDAIAANGGGGGGGLTVHVQGMISDDNLARVMKKMSKLVGSGKASLVSSDSHKVTKRGA
jgi:hypothetical protein